MIRTITRHALMAGGAALLLASAGSAQEPEPEPEQLGAFNDWSAYSYKTEAGTVCYIVSRPQDSEPKNVNRDPVFFLVTHRPGDKVRNEVNTIIGYPFKENSTATVIIGDDTYELFTAGDGAWAESPAHDTEIVEAMKAGATMRLEGTSWRGTLTKDRYSLSGVTAAMEKIDQACQ